MRGRLASATSACVIALAASEATAQTAVPSERFALCLVLSPKLSISERAAALVAAESNAIWSPHGVSVRRAEPSDESCDRLISVKGDDGGA